MSEMNWSTLNVCSSITDNVFFFRIMVINMLKSEYSTVPLLNNSIYDYSNLDNYKLKKRTDQSAQPLTIALKYYRIDTRSSIFST